LCFFAIFGFVDGNSFDAGAFLMALIIEQSALTLAYL
jgi:hypothetical protein